MSRALALALAASLAIAPPAWAAERLQQVELISIDGKRLPAEFTEGKVVLVVNVASFCGYTPQYADLQVLWERFRDRGLVVVGVPCNQFGGQEPGSEKEIKNFCSTRYGVTFPLLAKQDVNGPARSPLYELLVDSPAGGGRDVGWNFEKFVVGRDGRVLGRFGSSTSPSDPSLLAAVELALARQP